MTATALHGLLDRSVAVNPDRTALEEPPKGAITYRELAVLSDRVRDRLVHLGVQPGDRVGVYMRKSIDAIASILGALKAGAAYVPVDPSAPPARNAYVLHDCSVKVALLEARFGSTLRSELERLGSAPTLVELDGVGGGQPLNETLVRADSRHPALPASTVACTPDDLAYVLYTSGSTGKPKGVMLSHGAAVSFIDWCSEVFAPRPEDRFSSHAPLHFDLSILDLYLAFKHGATVVLIGEEIGKDPLGLATLMAEAQLTIWYSAPSILSLLAQYGNLGQHDYSALRLVLFAGEVFPVKHLRTLKALLPRPRYFNLYGPTETNVCTFYEIPATIPDERTVPYPIGKTCSHLRARVLDAEGSEVVPGAEGELCISGPAVMRGYWNLPEQTARGFVTDPGGVRWYRTGDIVLEDPDGDYVYLGRRDRMIKRRGYRIELGEIESGLYRHPAVKEAAVIALADDAGVRIKAFLSCREGKRPSLVELKRFCAEALPLYMVPDFFSFQATLPQTSTGKTDYQRLKEID
jgi:amino acid adenylation domain-containing protein